MGSARASKLQPSSKFTKGGKETLLPLPNTDSNPKFPSLTSPAPESNSPAMSIDGVAEDAALLRADFLSREEVLRRRSRRLKKLERVYSEQYWALMEEFKVKHRDYYWEFGKSPLEENDGDGSEEEGGLGLGFGENGGSNGGLGKGERKRCGFAGCKSKAMPLTRFCHPHILSDSKQTLYKACRYVTKRWELFYLQHLGWMDVIGTHISKYFKCAQSVEIICGKPVLRAAVPSLCHVHFRKIQKQILQALKKAGLNVSSSSTAAPKFNVLIAECVRHAQGRRKELNAKSSKQIRI